ncbi:MAG: nitrilase-related carbon-nitrogen hydrolase [Thermoplasmatota archaeon]
MQMDAPLSGKDWKDPIDACMIQTGLKLGDVDDNLERALKLIDRAAGEKDPDLIVLPEVFSTGFPYEKLPELSMRSGEVLESLRRKAREYHSHIIFTQVVEESGSFFNRCFALDEKGETAAVYNKTHLFSRAGEHEFFTQGNETASFLLKGARISPLICYELRFPELSRKLVLEGSHVLVYMGQWPNYRIFQWEALLKARAIENQCFVIGVGVWGHHGRQLMGGGSSVFSPFGNLLCSVKEGEGYAQCTMDPSELVRFREGIPVLYERRPDLY